MRSSSLASVARGCADVVNGALTFRRAGYRPGMDTDDTERFDDDADQTTPPAAPKPAREARDSVDRDTAYSPASETETQQKQHDPLPETIDDDIDPKRVRAVPGTGGPDDAGDVDVDPDELNLPQNE